MMYKIIGLLIGLLIFGAGIYYLIKEKNDPSSRNIHTESGSKRKRYKRTAFLNKRNNKMEHF